MVRDNEGRWLNLRVRSDDEGTEIFFTAPDDNIRSVKAMNFISHYVYYWKKDDHALYRAIYNTATEPEVLAATGADADNKNRSANQRRLSAMTLAYRSGAPYAWTDSAEMAEVMDQEPRRAVVRNVFGFDVRCYTEPKGEAGDDAGSPTWEDHTQLPLFIEIELRVADDQHAGFFEDELARSGTLSERLRKKAQALRHHRPHDQPRHQR